MQYFQAVQQGKKRANEAQMKLFDIAGFATLNEISMKADLSSTSLITISSRSITNGSILDIPPEEPIKPSPDVSSIIDVPEYAITKITMANPPITPRTGIFGFNRNFLFFVHKKESKIYL